MNKKLNITKKQLEKFYIDNYLSMGKIAELYNCHPFAILELLRKYDIKSRSLSEAMAKIKISKERLIELYKKKKLSTMRIARIYNCNHVTILNKMKKFGIKSRTRLGTRKPISISKQSLVKLYGNNKLSQVEIAKKLHCSLWGIQRKMHQYSIESRTLSEAQMKYPKTDFSGNLKEKAYLIGFRLGDLHIRMAKKQIHVGCSSTISAQIQLIRGLFSKYTYVYSKPSRILNGKQVIDIQCLLNESFEFLLKKEDNIEKWILNTINYFYAFLAGYIDAEGSILFRLNKKYGKTPYVILEIQSYDKNIICQAWDKLNSIGILSPKPKINQPKGYLPKSGIGKKGPNKKDAWRLSINRKESLWKLFDKIEPFIKHLKRKEKLLRAKQNLKLRLGI